MEIYTVSLFGHRDFNGSAEVTEKLEKIVEKLIESKEYVEFLVGRNGSFDIFASSVIKQAKQRLDRGNCSLVLVLPYMTAEYRDNEKSFGEYYDSVEICGESGHFKSAFQVRNRNMVDRSDMVICCVERNSGGAYQTKKYAETRKKKIVELT